MAEIELHSNGTYTRPRAHGTSLFTGRLSKIKSIVL